MGQGHETHSRPSVLRRPSVCGAGAPRQQCGVGSVMEIVPSQLFCVVSLSSSTGQDQDGGCLLAERRSSGQGAVLIGIHIPQLRSSQAQDKIQMLKVDTRG